MDDFFTQVRRDTTRIIVESIGEPSMRERRSHGAAMDHDQTCSFAQAAIAAYFTDEPTSQTPSLEHS
jgi:hypothetical protein